MKNNNLNEQQSVSALNTHKNDILTVNNHSSIQLVNKNDNNLFTVRSANDWLEVANRQPIPKMLFGELWYRGELCILFSETNLGKSILAAQIAESISTGRPIRPFSLGLNNQKVLYFDFELSERQFQSRYSENYQNNYQFSDNFFRSDINICNDIPDKYKKFDDYLKDCLEYKIIEVGANIIIVDNLTFLATDNERSKNAINLMRHLTKIKKDYGLSILVLAHTPKRRLFTPLTKNCLQGSRMIMNFCDSCFAIGGSSVDDNLRYIIQIKQRGCEKLYGANNVCEFRINKPSNFLQFEFVGFGSEEDHLKKPDAYNREDLIKQAIQLKLQGKSLRQIGDEMGVSHMKISRMLVSASVQ